MNKLKLYGSLTSPFVRRIRLLLANQDYDFELFNVFDVQDRQKLADINPVVKIPVLVDGDKYIYDSRQIYLYLKQKYQLETENSWQENNFLTTIDGATDALVILFYLKQSGVDTTEPSLIVNNNKQRIQAIFKYLDNQWANRKNSWRYVDICLFCLLDWVGFRDLYDLKPYQNLIDFHKANLKQNQVEQTRPKV